MTPLDNQVAIVTGGARGIGFGIAQVLRAEGARVVIADHDGEAARAAAEALAGSPAGLRPRTRRATAASP